MLTTLLIFLAACDNATEEITAVTESGAGHAHASAHTEPAVAPDADGWSHHGTASAIADARPATDVLGNPAQLVDQTVLLEGKVTDVCPKAGCWMVITDDEHTMRVLMQDHSFAVDKGGTGAHCRVEGIDPAEVAHLESEPGDVENMPEKAATGNIIYQMVATGVAMKRPAEG